MTTLTLHPKTGRHLNNANKCEMMLNLLCNMIAEQPNNVCTISAEIRMTAFIEHYATDASGTFLMKNSVLKLSEWFKIFRKNWNYNTGICDDFVRILKTNWLDLRNGLKSLAVEFIWTQLSVTDCRHMIEFNIFRNQSNKIVPSKNYRCVIKIRKIYRSNHVQLMEKQTLSKPTEIERDK